MECLLFLLFLFIAGAARSRLSGSGELAGCESLRRHWRAFRWWNCQLVGVLLVDDKWALRGRMLAFIGS